MSGANASPTGRSRKRYRSQATVRVSDHSYWLRPIGLAFALLMPVCALRWLRGFLLLAQPPLLFKEGNRLFRPVWR